MTKLLLALPLAFLAATPAFATGGLFCQTAGPRPITVSLGIGHVAGAPLISARLIDNGRNVPVSRAQWWLDDSEVRLVLADPNGMRRELILKAKKTGRAYDGNVWRRGQRRWVRCRES